MPTCFAINGTLACSLNPTLLYCSTGSIIIMMTGGTCVQIPRISNLPPPSLPNHRTIHMRMPQPSDRQNPRPPPCPDSKNRSQNHLISLYHPYFADKIDIHPHDQ